MKRKIFLFAVLLPCIAFSMTAVFAFKPASGKPAIETSVKQVYDDSDEYWQAKEDELSDLAYDTWVADGSPGGDDIKANKNGKFNHYCCKSSGIFLTRAGRVKWIEDQMGPGNSNHVHFIQWDVFYDGWCYCIPNYSAKVKYWTSAPCTELCNW